MGGLFLCDLDFSVSAVGNLKSHHQHPEPIDPIINRPTVAGRKLLNEGGDKRIIRAATARATTRTSAVSHRSRASMSFAGSILLRGRPGAGLFRPLVVEIGSGRF